MTECERLISTGAFSAEFFCAEVRNGFVVNEKRKKLWAIEIDLIRQLDCVCRKYDLQYWLMWGSLLGAVRHHGFIPWDDDVDVVMMRSDYEKLLTLGSEFASPYFLQTPYTDPEYFYAFARLRNSNTTYLSKPFLYQNINHGIPLDIFPLDFFEPNLDGEARFNRIAKAVIDNSTYMRSRNPYLNEKDKERVRNYPGGDPLMRYEWIQHESARDNGKGTKYLWLPTCCSYGFAKNVYRYEDFKSTKTAIFEGFCFPIPSGWDRVLTTAYGNYMELPSPEKRYPWFGADYSDADVSFTDYLVKLKSE